MVFGRRGPVSAKLARAVLEKCDLAKRRWWRLCGSPRHVSARSGGEATWSTTYLFVLSNVGFQV